MMTEQSETLANIETDSQMEEKRRKLNPRPESDQNDNPLDSKKRKLTQKNEPHTADNTSTNEEAEETKELDACGEAVEKVSVAKENFLLSKSTKKTRSKSRSNIKSKSRSKSKSKPRVRLLNDSVKKSASKVKEAFLSESSYSLRPRHNIDYSAAVNEEEISRDKLVSDTGISLVMLDKEDPSDMSFKEDSEKSEKNSAKVSPKQEDTRNPPVEEEKDELIEDALVAAENVEEVAADEEPSEVKNCEANLDESHDTADIAEDGKDPAAIREEILEELKELQGKSISLTFNLEEDILNEKEKYQEFKNSEETLLMKTDSEKIEGEAADKI